MKPRTREHLDTARRNRDVATALIDSGSMLGVAPPPLEWALVIAFYAAVHYVNAYLWEKLNYQPTDHATRAAAVARDATLRPISPAYVRLRELAFEARYRPGFVLPRAAVEMAVRSDLADIERRVLAAL